jgi:RNA polymerase sigma factor (sigma-70 family)|tara:strand:+ start:662 stop:1213 length:552 start_codon:yes stop_codon:yes gene_type:complete
MPNELDDLIQTVWLRAWRVTKTIDSITYVRAWLTTILQREYARQWRRREMRENKLEYSEDPGEIISEEKQYNETVLEQLFNRTPKKYSEVGILRVLGYTNSEIGKILNISRIAVGTRLNRLPKLFNGESILNSYHHVCKFCLQKFTSNHKKQTFCSTSCANRERFTKLNKKNNNESMYRENLM